MALQFDMSKNNWQQDLMLQEQMRELGENLGDAGAVAGGALGKALLPTGGRKIAAKFPKFFKEKETAKQKYDKAKKDWDDKIANVWATRASDITNDMKGEYIRKHAPGLTEQRPTLKDFQADYKFTPGRGLLNLGKKVGTAAAVVPGAAYFAGKKIYEGGKGVYDASKKYITESPDYFEGEGLADSPLANLLQKRKSKRLQKKARKKDLVPSTREDYDFMGEAEYDDVPAPGYGDLPEFEAPIPRSTTNIPEEIEAKRKRDISNMQFNPSVLYSGKEAEARGALMNQIYGPLQSLMMQQQQSQPNVEQSIAPPVASPVKPSAILPAVEDEIDYDNITPDMIEKAPIEYYGPASNAMLYEMMQRNKIRPNSGLDTRRNTPY